MEGPGTSFLYLRCPPWPCRSPCLAVERQRMCAVEVRLAGNAQSSGQACPVGLLDGNHQPCLTCLGPHARSFQSPVEVPGVSNVDFLRLAGNARRRALGKPELDPLEFYGELVPKLAALNMDHKFLERDVNTGFSGGEKKRNEILQLAVLEARARGACLVATICAGLVSTSLLSCSVAL